MKHFISKKYLGIVLSVGILLCLTGVVFSQSNIAKPDDDQKPALVDPSIETGKDASSDNTTQGTVNPSETKNITVIAPPRVVTNPALQTKVNDQFHWTPEDPSFLYETRYIPDRKKEQEFLSPDLEKVVVKERIKEDMDFRKSLGKIKIRLPDLTQALILVGIIVIVLVYRARVRRLPDMRK